MDVILKKEEKPALDEMLDFLRSLTVEEQKEMSKYLAAFKDGFKWSKMMNGSVKYQA